MAGDRIKHCNLSSSLLFSLSSLLLRLGLLLGDGREEMVRPWKREILFRLL